jgi:hypothetical protein
LDGTTIKNELCFLIFPSEFNESKRANFIGTLKLL